MDEDDEGEKKALTVMTREKMNRRMTTKKEQTRSAKRWVFEVFHNWKCLDYPSLHQCEVKIRQDAQRPKHLRTMNKASISS
jgi:hypothetical protein